ncbi:YcxB family protein [uncultured Tenacibaculum sp.]|uniref:YcxB family protein n=1 Tax=uncultured Tenacibaculum sp. TaxID=174713 RepID=UPI00262D8B81|nr:YcxB family protein [uncultured Tenacibaculum sp.]
MKSKGLSKTQKNKIFLEEYYFGYGVFYTLLRILAGPLILIIGYNLYTPGNYKGLLFIGFGVYYTLQPLILLISSKTWFERFDLNYTVTPNKLIIATEKSKSELDYSEFRDLKKRKNYYVLITKHKQTIHLPFEILNQEEIEILEKLKEHGKLKTYQ